MLSGRAALARARPRIKCLSDNSLALLRPSLQKLVRLDCLHLGILSMVSRPNVAYFTGEKGCHDKPKIPQNLFYSLCMKVGRDNFDGLDGLVGLQDQGSFHFLF